MVWIQDHGLYKQTSTSTYFGSNNIVSFKPLVLQSKAKACFQTLGVHFEMQECLLELWLGIEGGSVANYSVGSQYQGGYQKFTIPRVGGVAPLGERKAHNNARRCLLLRAWNVRQCKESVDQSYSYLYSFFVLSLHNVRGCAPAHIECGRLHGLGWPSWSMVVWW